MWRVFVRVETGNAERGEGGAGVREGDADDLKDKKDGRDRKDTGALWSGLVVSIFLRALL